MRNEGLGTGHTQSIRTLTDRFGASIAVWHRNRHAVTHHNRLAVRGPRLLHFFIHVYRYPFIVGIGVAVDCNVKKKGISAWALLGVACLYLEVQHTLDI